MIAIVLYFASMFAAVPPPQEKGICVPVCCCESNR
jgi:hypothetical protein